MTWLSGMVLLVVVDYSSSGLIDPDIADISQARGIAIGLGVLAGGWMVYDLALRSPLGRSEGGVAVAAAGKTFDSALSAQAKLRSKHNTFMAVPVVFIMISNHFPVATYGNKYGWEVLVALVVVGWGAAKLIRES